jgi:hypothetical protein
LANRFVVEDRPGGSSNYPHLPAEREQQVAMLPQRQSTTSFLKDLLCVALPWRENIGQARH